MPGPPRRSQGPPSQSASVQISKALSWLLRHGAAKERIVMDPSGYVKVNDVLHWGKMRALKAGFQELVDVVEENEKQRFGMRYHGKGGKLGGNDKEGITLVAVAGTDEDGRSTSGEINALEQSTPDDLALEVQPVSPSKQQEQTTHQLALAKFHSESSPNPSHYSIRAVQGHSIRTVEAAELHQPIKLSDPSSIPPVCVHGTFRSVWPAILNTGGLKAMNRVQVHFSSGPRPEHVLRIEEGKNEDGGEKSRKLKDAMARSQVVSGMRPDAELLIYVDVKRSLEAGMEWWRSENGVILTEGIVVAGAPAPEEELSKEDRTEERHSERRDAKGKATMNRRKREQKIVPMEYWDTVIEVGLGLGVVWEQGKGVLQDVPRGQSRKGPGSGGARVGQGKISNGKPARQGKPTLNVERSSVHDALREEG